MTHEHQPSTTHLEANGTSFAPLNVSPDLVAGYEVLRATVATDLSTSEDVRAYRQNAELRSPDPATVTQQYGMHREDVTLETGAVYSRFISAAAETVTRGIIVFVHGGGLIAGNRFDGVEVALEPAAAIGLEVWSVEYGLAPETSFAQAVNTCEHVVEAALATDIGPVIIAGQSAGGGLAAATALRLRDRGDHRLLGQLLICPMLDDRSETVSMLQFESDPSWSRISNITGWRAALADGNTAQVPGRTESLAALPQTFLDTGSAEVFRDDICSYASRLWAAGVPTELHVWEGGFHAFDCVVPEAEVSRAARAARTTWLQRVFAAA